MKVFFMCVLLLSSHWATAKVGSQAGFADLIVQYKQHYGFSGAVLVLKNGKPIFTKAQGYADDVKLQEITFADSKTNKITIQQLLEHRSGFADIFTAEYRKNPSKYTNIAEKMEILRQQPLLFEPGTERKYSNYGYIVLGAILEKVTKQDYWTLLEKNVLQPSRTALATKQSGHDFVALPNHFNYEGKRQLVDPSMLEHKTPAGGGELTVYELYGVYQQLFNQKKLLSDSSLQIFRILPATLFAYQQYQQLGEKLFGMQFETVYKNAGYQTFLGKTITDLA